MIPDPSACYRALSARDPRFDGLFFVGVATTGIYCRSVCPARTPRKDRCRFFARAAEAERAGYRACWRCRPEVAPGAGAFGPGAAAAPLVARAVSCIEAGWLHESSLERLAREVGVSARHLRRAMVSELGLTPVELAQSRKMALAKQLLQDTALPMAEVAFAAGFTSVRRFNALFRARFGRTPSSLRREHGKLAAPDAVVLRLDYRPPLAWESMLGFLAARVIPGVEEVTGGAYRRTLRVGSRTGWIEARRAPNGRAALQVEVSGTLRPVLMTVVASVRALFDLDARPDVVDAHLSADRLLAPLVRTRPGLRLPGAVDGFEIATRAIAGQQVSLRSGLAVCARLARAHGEPIATPFPGLDLVFPAPTALASRPERLQTCGLPATRASALVGLARAAHRGDLSLGRNAVVPATRERLVSLPGVGPWTAEYVLMRALGWPDAFLPSDVGVRRAIGAAGPREALERAERWKPWRSYAVAHLWTALAAGELE